jgi:hypothetical protein
MGYGRCPHSKNGVEWRGPDTTLVDQRAGIDWLALKASASIPIIGRTRATIRPSSPQMSETTASQRCRSAVPSPPERQVSDLTLALSIAAALGEQDQVFDDLSQRDATTHLESRRHDRWIPGRIAVEA